MTILIAVAMHEAVVLMADGRRSNRADGIINDEAEKVSLLRHNLALAVGGAEMGTNIAEEQMRRQAGGTAPEVQQQLSGLSFACARHVGDLITSSTRHLAHVKVSLIAGGFDNDGAFLAAGLFGDDTERPDAPLVRPAASEILQFIVNGGESVGAQSYFHGAVTKLLSLPEVDVRNARSLVDIVVAAGEATVRYAECGTIGGRIQYRVLWRGGSHEQGYRHRDFQS